MSRKLEVEDVRCLIGGLNKVFGTMGGIKMVEVVDGWRSEMTLIWGFALTDVTISTCRFRRALQWMNR